MVLYMSNAEQEHLQASRLRTAHAYRQQQCDPVLVFMVIYRTKSKDISQSHVEQLSSSIPCPMMQTRYNNKRKPQHMWQSESTSLLNCSKTKETGKEEICTVLFQDHLSHHCPSSSNTTFPTLGLWQHMLPQSDTWQLLHLTDEAFPGQIRNYTCNNRSLQTSHIRQSCEKN